MTCEDMAQQLGTDAYAPEPGCPAWATCEACAHCECAHGLEDPFWWLTDTELRDRMRASCGICVEQADEALVVALDTGRADMPCGGDFWEAR